MAPVFPKGSTRSEKNQTNSDVFRIERERERERVRQGDNEERARRCWDQDEKQRGESKA